MFFRILVALWFCFLSLSAHANDPSCKTSLIPDRTSDFDAYATFLRYHPTQTQTVTLFEESRSNPSLRITLNDKITADAYLSEASTTGLQFHSWVSTYTRQELTHVEPPKEALTPWQNLESDYQVFLKNLKSKPDRPMSDSEAERKARSDTASRFGIAPEFSSAIFAQDPDIRFYFQRRKNYYLNQEVPTASLNPSKQEERFRYWLSKKIDQLELERAENLKALMFETTHTTHRRIFFDYGYQRIKNPLWTRTTTLGFLANAKPKIVHTAPESSALEVKPDHFGFRQDQTFFQKAIDSDLWYTPYSRAYALTPKENAPSDPSSLSFTLAPDGVHEIESSLRGIGVDPSSIQEIRVPISELVEFMQKSATKSDYPGALVASTQIHARIEYEHQLREKIAELRSLGSHTTMTQFGQWTTTRATAEREHFRNSTATPGILNRLQHLERPTLHDPMTGLEWFGYAIHPNYWNQRDLAATTSHTGVPGRWISDLWDKSKKFTRQAAVIGTLTSIAWGGIGIAEREGYRLPRLHSKSIEIGTTDEAQDSFGLQNDADGDGVPDTLFTVRSERVNRRTWNPLYLPVESVPRYFDHATITDTRDTSELIDVTDQIPHEMINTNALDTISRQTITVSTKMYQIPMNGYLFLPLPEGYDLVYYDRLLEDSLRIYRNQQTGMYLLKVIKSPFDEFTFDAGYVKISPMETPPRLRELLSNLDRSRIVAAQKKIEAAGLTILAQDLSHLLETPDPISAQAISDLIQQGQRYSLKPGKGPKWIYKFSENPYSRFSRYLREDGRLHFKCDIANDLLQTLLREIMGPGDSLIIRPLHSFVYDKNQNVRKRDFEMGHIGGIGHARTQIMIPGTPGKVVLDATPFQLSDESVAGTEPELDPDPDFLQESSSDENDKKSPSGTLPEPVRPRTDLKSEIERRKLALLHQERIEQLEDLAEMLLNGSSFQSWVKKNPREYLPPQRVYILARRVLDYAKERTSLEELNRALKELLLFRESDLPTDPSMLQASLRKFADDELATWDRCALYQEKSRKWEFAWAQDSALRHDIDLILNLLTSHSWRY